MKKSWKRLGALLMALVMIVSLVPGTALAARMTDDEIAMDAPEVVVDEARPAGAVDAAEAADIEDVPAVLMEGEENIAQGKTVYVSGVETSTGTGPNLAVDGNPSTHWSSSPLKSGGAGTSSTEGAVAWIVVDLLDEDSVTKAVDSITGITMSFNMKVWPTACKVQVATGEVSAAVEAAHAPNNTAMKYLSDYADGIFSFSDDNDKWKTIATFSKTSSDDGAGGAAVVTMSTDYAENKTVDTIIQVQPDSKADFTQLGEGIRYVRLCVTGLNTNGASCLGLKELEVKGTIKDVITAEDDSLDFPVSSMEITVSNAAGDNSDHNEGPKDYAKDGQNTTWWHTDYAGGATQTTPETRWIGVNLGEARKVRAIRYLHRQDKDGEHTGRTGTGNGYVTEYKVQTSENGTDWTDVEGASGTWDTYTVSGDTVTVNGNWRLALLPNAVSTQYIRVVGVHTEGEAGADKHMHAAEIRVVLAEAAQRSISGTVVDSANQPIGGATVTVGSKSVQTGDDGTFAIEGLLAGTAYSVTASKESYNPKTVNVDADTTEGVTITLRQAIAANDDTYDYPLTETATIITASSYDVSEDTPIGKALDEQDSTFWGANWHTGDAGTAANPKPTTASDNYIQFALPENVSAIGVRYKGRAGNANGRFSAGKLQYKASEGDEWVDKTTFSGWANDDGWKIVTLDDPVTGGYLRIVPTSLHATTEASAAEIRLVLDPAVQRYDISGTVTSSSSPVENATVSGGGKTTTTAANGTYTLTNMLPGDYTITVSKPGYKSATLDVTVSNGNLTAQDATLEMLSLALTGTVKSGTDTVEGARLTLLTHDNSRNHTAGVDVGTSGVDGTFSMDVSQYGLGQAYLLVTHPNYETACIEVNLTEENNGANVGDIALTGSEPYKVYTFDGANAQSEVAEFTKNADTVEATVTLENGAMKYTTVSDAATLKNIIVNKNFVMQNGTVEFDVTPITTFNGDERFGVVLHVPSGKNARIHLGQRDNATQYGYQSYNHSAEINNAWGSADNRPAMQKDVTRHVAITLNGSSAAIKVDGMEAWSSNITLPSDDAAGYFGFTTRYSTTQFLIDNLVIRRADAKNTVSWTAGEGETLTAAIVTPDNTTGTALTSGGNAYAGDTIKITGTKTGAILNAVTVNGNAEGVTKAEVEGGGYEYTFTMPAQAATVAGTFVDLIPNFTVSGADASGSISAGTVGESGFTGNTLAIQGEMANDGGARFEWYKKTGDGEWTKIDTATGSSYTLQENDYSSTTTTKLKVKVIGNETHHAGWRESDEFTVAPPVYAVTGVTLERDTLTMWANHTPTTSGEFPTEVGSTATMTATVAPGDVTGAVITWSSSNEALVTVEKSATDPKMATLSVVAGGVSATAAENTATITVSVTAGGVTKTATCAVTVKTKVASITVKNGETAVTTTAPVKVYLNDDDATAPRTVTVKGTVEPTTASDKGLVWSLATGSTTGRINIQPVGGSDENPNSAESSGNGVTISAVGTDAKNVGAVTVKVAAHDGLGAETTFTVQVWRKLAHEVTIGGTPKYGEKLEVNTGNLDMTTDNKNKLSYSWYRLDAATDEITAEMDAIHTGTGDEGKEYELTSADVGKFIAVVVTADPTTFYEGTKTAVTATKVAKADAPNAPTLSPTKPSAAGATDGYITITNYNSAYTYEIKTGEGSWEEATVTSEGKIENLAAGSYSVKVQATTTQEESAVATTSIAAGDAVEYDISYTDPTAGATISVTDKSAANETVTITLTVTAGWKVDAVTVTGASGTTVTVTGEGNTRSFTMPGENVTVAVEVSKIKVTITHDLENLTCNITEHNADGNHEVDYSSGEYVITLTPATGFALPVSITVTYKDTEVSGAERWEYDGETGKITFKYGIQYDITITAKATQITHTVQLSATDGLLDLSNDEATVNDGATFTGTLSVSNDAYELPSTITVTMIDAEGEAETLIAGTGYTYSSTTGEISIPNVTGDVTITAKAKEKTTGLTGVTIGILHSDSTGMGSSQEKVPHVGDTLTATAAPTGATVSYQWFVGDSTTAAGSSQTFKVPDEEGIVGKTIKVEVMGTGTYEGTESATTVAVGEKTWRVTGVSLNKTSTSIEFGGEETLTATIEPSTATNKKVSWTSSNTAAATVDANGKVTAVGVGTATITATTEDGEQTATCQVTVTAKALPALQITKPQAGKTVTVSFVGGVSTDVATYEWYIADNAQGPWSSRIQDVSGNTWTVNAPSGYYIKVVAIANNSNYTGSSEVVSAAILSNDAEVETYAITVDKTGEGTVAVKVNGTDATEAAEGDGVTIEVTGVAAGATVEATSATEGVTLAKGTGNTWTFTMPAEAVEITVTITGSTEPPAPTAYTVTVSDTANGTVTADKETAAEGEKVTLTVTPADGYKLDTLTVSGGVTVADDNTFTMPAANVTVTATFVALTAAEKLDNAIEAAKAAKDGIASKPNDTAASSVSKDTKYVTEDEMTTLNDAIAAAEAVQDKADATNAEIEAATADLKAATEAFKAAIKTGTKANSSSRPSTSTESPKTEVTEDGTKVTTETKPDGTKVQTTEKPDGTKETVETKRDGTVTEKVETPDGTKTETETKPDGTVTEKVEEADGTKSESVTKPDGSKTATVEQADGTKSETVVTAEGEATVTVTDPEGEELAKVEIPAEIPEPEAEFEDIDQTPWAKEAINKVAGLELVKGIGGNKYDPITPMTRGALATVLHRLSQGKTDYDVTFKDVAQGKYYTEGVAWAAKANVVKGLSKDVFAPESIITREQLAVMLARYAKLIGMNAKADAKALEQFIDGDDTNTWAVDGMAWCVANGILQGKGGNVLAPTAEVSRAEVAVMLDRFISLIK